jgi:hypothetical protein
MQTKCAKILLLSCAIFEAFGEVLIMKPQVASLEVIICELFGQN